MTPTVTIDTNKEIAAFKVCELWFGAINVDDTIHVVPTGFPTPLKAASNAKKVRKQMNLTTTKKTKVDKKPKVSIIKRKVKLWSEEEMQDRTDLAFKEVWVILNKEGMFVSSSLKDKKLATYSNNKQDAEIYSTYEDATVRIKTLNSCVKCGHRARRYFVEQNA